MIDIFEPKRSHWNEGIHLTRILPTLNYESTRCARFKAERSIKGRKCVVIEEVREVRFLGPVMSDYRIRWAEMPRV